MQLGAMFFAALVLMAGSAVADHVVVAPGCTNSSVTEALLEQKFFNGFDPSTGTVVAQHVFTRASENSGLSAGSDPTICAALTSPCTLAFEIVRFAADTITGEPTTDIFVGPSPECNINSCQGAVTTLDPATETLSGQFFARGTDTPTFPVTGKQFQPDPSLPTQLTFEVPVAPGVICTLIYDADSPAWIDIILGPLPPPPAPASPAPVSEVGDCVIIGASGVLDGPAKKSFGRCQWQCLTDFGCTSMTFNGAAFARADLPTTDGTAFGDPYFTAGGSPGLCVLFDAEGTIIDTQEQSCQLCEEQCDFWAQCASFTHNYVADVCEP